MGRYAVIWNMENPVKLMASMELTVRKTERIVLLCQSISALQRWLQLFRMAGKRSVRRMSDCLTICCNRFFLKGQISNESIPPSAVQMGVLYLFFIDNTCEI